MPIKVLHNLFVSSNGHHSFTKNFLCISNLINYYSGNAATSNYSIYSYLVTKIVDLN